jgi:spermidine/putrescine transport system permease protein
MVKRRVTPEINALSTLIFGTMLILLILVNVLQMRSDPHKKRRVTK